MRAWLKEIRRERKMTMEQVATAASISQSYYSDIENSRPGYNIPVHTAKAIAAALGFAWEMFYSDGDADEKDAI